MSIPFQFQGQLAQLLLGSSAAPGSDPLGEVGSPLRKTFPTIPFPPATPTPSANQQQQLTLGTINQQLNALSQQLSGLNQQTQNLQMHGANSSLLAGFNVNKLGNDMLSQQDLFSLNQDLLARLQQLNLGGGAGNNNNAMQSGSSSNSGPNSASPSSFIFTNPMNVGAGGRPNSFANATTNSLLLGSSLADTGGSLTPSPLSGTLNRNSFSPSPSLLDNYEHLMAAAANNQYEAALQMQSDANNNAEGGGLIRPISQVGTLTTMDAAGKLKVIVPVKATATNSGNISPSILTNDHHHGTFQLTPVLKRPEKKVTLSSASPSCSSSQTSSLRSDSNRSNPNMVTLKITDEEGHSHSPKRAGGGGGGIGSQPLSATPSFITRSTSEKVPNRSQMMQQVQRTAWARHTTK